MKIEIHIRETDSCGKRLGKRNAFVESCRVYKEAGDGIRLDNMAKTAYIYFNLHAKNLAKAWRESKTYDDFLFSLNIPNASI